MDSSNSIPKPKLHPKPTELTTITRQYNSLQWRIKGVHSNISGIKSALPRLPVLTITATRPANELSRRLYEALCETDNNIVYCEHLIKELSLAHRTILKSDRLLATHTKSTEGG